ncbi:hypothetical protein [Halobacillus sp. Marseille-Q1614]|uniref:hypothetical protein n=1 Tax=Halobacillus sp. Marseille-Q1614 TaxID=2709134 RepID=UPI00156F5771|nr:hypothetical protein [Halobacillus sp. Marseille-Q1614]
MSFNDWYKERLEKQIGEGYDKRKKFDQFMFYFLIFNSILVILLSILYREFAVLFLLFLLVTWGLFFMTKWMNNVLRNKAEKDLAKFQEKERKHKKALK